jgi:hypothetical protein
MIFTWLAEALYSQRGTYAPRDYNTGNMMTTDPYEAMRFETKEACHEWCLNNPFPTYVPVQHGLKT